MRFNAMSILGLAFQSAKVVKRNITVVLTYSTHVFQSAIVIFRFTLLSDFCVFGTIYRHMLF